MTLLEQFLLANRSRQLCLNVVGDALIDEYYEVLVNRISPEFPMPIMSSKSISPIRRPGGAANVAHQFRNFNVRVNLFCLADLLATQVYDDHQLSRDNQEFLEHGQIPLKRRYLDHGIQVNRWDVEDTQYGLSDEELVILEMKLMNRLMQQPSADLTIFSDYNKGLFCHTRAWMNCQSLHPKNLSVTLVDPKTGPLSKWHGCTIFKPNAQEALKLTGLSDPRDQIQRFYGELHCRHVFITHGGGSVIGAWDREYFEYHPTKRVNVESVIGAGDCFVAFLAMAIAHGFQGAAAAEIAYEAGSLYVQHRMNRPLVPAELSPTKIVSAEDLTKRDFKLVLTNGCFDVFHAGHLATLEFAKSKGQKLAVALNVDETIQNLKGPHRPINTLINRSAVLAGLSCVDFIIPFVELTPLETIQICRPDVLVKGADYDLKNIVGAELVSEVYQAPLIPNLSSTNILDRLLMTSS